MASVDSIETSVVLDFGNICRLCLADSENGVSVYESYEKIGGNTLASFLYTLTSLEMDISDPYPGMICSECYNTLESTFAFIDQCMLSNATLHQWYETATTVPVQTVPTITNRHNSGLDELVDFLNDDIDIEISRKVGTSESKQVKGDVDLDWVLNAKRATKQQNGSARKDEVVTCAICSKRYTSKRSLLHHITNHHFGTDKDSYLICSYCGKMIKGKRNLDTHIKTMHESKTLNCPVCGKTFKQQFLQRHLALHRGKKQFLCNTCGKVLKSARNLEQHERQHQGNPQFECSYCGKGFVVKQSYEKHLRVHQGLPPTLHECDICQQSFKGSHTLKRHLLTHSGTRPFSCHVCLKSFYTISEMKRHANHHTGTPTHRCPYCDKTFWERTRLRHHIMAHKKIRLHRCELCPVSFADKKKLKSHLARRHQIRMQKTERSYCDPKTYIPLEKLLEL